MMKLVRISLFVLTLCGVFFLFIGCSKEKTVTRTDFAMDTVVTITVYNESEESVLTKPFALIKNLDEKFNAFSTSSEITVVNQKAGLEAVEVSEDTFELIKKGLEYGKTTDGKLDITIGPLVDLWNIKENEDGIVPNQDQIKSAQDKVDYRKIILNDVEKTVFLEDEGMKINLGAIAKGYIGDRVKALMEDMKIQNAVINLGGNVVLIGGKNQQNGFNVGVENPLNPTGDPIGILQLSDQSVVTSGDYQRYFIGEDKKKYHHIIDPKTGYPSDLGVHQVTIVTDSSVDADALSTSCFLMGIDRSMEYLDSIDGVEAIFVTMDKKVVVTKGLENNFVFDESKMGRQYKEEIKN